MARSSWSISTIPRRENPADIEANPRIGETLNAMFSGINLCQMVVALATGESVPTSPPPSQIGIRSHVDFLLLIADAMRGTGRRRLLHRLTQMVRKSGEFQGAFFEMTRPRDDWASLIPATVAWHESSYRRRSLSNSSPGVFIAIR